MVEVIGLAVAGLLFVWWQLRDVAQAAKRTREQEQEQEQEREQEREQAQAREQAPSGTPGQPLALRPARAERGDPLRPDTPRT